MPAGVRTGTDQELLDADHSRQGQAAQLWEGTQLPADQPSLSLHSFPNVCGVERPWLARPTAWNRRTRKVEGGGLGGVEVRFCLINQSISQSMWREMGLLRVGHNNTTLAQFLGI